MLLTGLTGRKNATVKHKLGYGGRAYFCRDFSALVALFPELGNKIRARKSIRHHLDVGASREI